MEATHSHTAAAAAAKSLQLCLTLCDPIDGNPPGSPVPGILQARTLEWVLFQQRRGGRGECGEDQPCGHEASERDHVPELLPRAHPAHPDDDGEVRTLQGGLRTLRASR